MRPQTSGDECGSRRSIARASGLVLILLSSACGRDTVAAKDEPARETPAGLTIQPIPETPAETPERSRPLEFARRSPSDRARTDTDPAGVSPPTAVATHLRVERSDLPTMVQTRRVRVLVPDERPFFFIDNGRARGITQELFREYGSFVEDRQGMRKGDLEMILIPCELDAQIRWLQQGYGDIAAAGLTVTPEREREIAFSAPLVTGVREIVVTSAGSTSITALEDLSGREVWVTASSSYAEHLRQISADFVERDLAPIEVVEAHTTLSTEDLLEMVHAGIVELTVCDDYKANLWAEVLSGLHTRADLVVHEAGALAWAVRPDNPELLESLNAFVATAKKGTLLGNVLIKRYFESTRWIENPNDPENRARIEGYVHWLQLYSNEHGFDWIRVAAQCFQESQLDPLARSSAGALGLMQLLPSTAADMGCDDPLDPEQNLRAGVKYLDWLRTHFFDDPGLDETERMDFILAAYNAGPGNVRKWRREAPQRGLDPNRWRDNVERIALERVGVQPIRYVDNIEKYYVAYTLAHDLAQERRRRLEQARDER